MKNRNYIVLWLVVLGVMGFSSCSRPGSNEPAMPGDSIPDITPGSAAFIGDYTEDLASAAATAFDIVRVGVRVGENLDSLCQVVSPLLTEGQESKGLYFLLEFTDTTSALDYHYLPACWRDVPAGQPLADTVYQYTRRVCQSCIVHCQSSTIQYIQLSRDISHGLLWHSASDQLVLTKPISVNPESWQQQALYIKAAVRAIRECCPEARIVLQTSKVGSTESLHEQLPRLINNWAELGIDYDVLSFYVAPAIRSSLSDFENGLSVFDFALVADKELHFETFYPCSADIPEEVFVRSASKAGYPYTPNGQRDYLKDWKGIIRSRLATSGRANATVAFVYRYATQPAYFRLYDYQYLGKD